MRHPRQPHYLATAGLSKLAIGKAERWALTKHQGYYISNLGRVERAVFPSRERNRKRLIRRLVPIRYCERTGRPFVLAFSLGIGRLWIDQLVADAFLPKAPAGSPILFRNGYVSDCTIWNLYREGPPFYMEDLPHAVEDIKTWGRRQTPHLLDFLSEKYNVQIARAAELVRRVRATRP